MSDSTNVDDFFDNTGSSGPLPSAKLSKPGDVVYGEIVDQFKVEAKVFGKDEVEKDKKTGEPIMQLVVVLQTEHRNWENVAKVPLADKDDKRSGDMDPSEDEGRRAVYVKPFTNIHAAIGKAIIEATGVKGGLKTGGSLGVRITELEDTGKGNPLKHHAAKYEPPAAGGADFFGESKTQGGSGDASVKSDSAEKPKKDKKKKEKGKTPKGDASQDPWGDTTKSSSNPPF